MHDLCTIKENLCTEIKKYAAISRYNSSDIEMIGMLLDNVKDIETILMLEKLNTDRVEFSEEEKQTLKKLLAWMD